jgi:hypothetical protein
MRPWVACVYDIPPEQVAGSSIKTKYEVRDGKPVLTRLPELNFIKAYHVVIPSFFIENLQLTG